MADTIINSSTLDKLSSKFSINNFVTDLPRMLNEAFSTIVSCIKKFYNPDEDSIKCSKLDTTYIDTTTIVAQNLKFKGEGGTIYNYNDIGSKIEKLETLINSITHITKEQIDSLEYYPLQPWPLYADSYNRRPLGTIPDGYVNLITDGIETYDSENEEWYANQVSEGVIYMCKSNMHVYRRVKDPSTAKLIWDDLGEYKNVNL